jgi:6-pyruvoyl-tetrahydropterin synthase
LENQKAQVKAISQLVSKNFTVDEPNSLIPATDLTTLEAFKEYLAERLADLLEKKYETLINILYRIDVNENKLAELFSAKNRENLPEKLAEMIIERQLQKVRFRQQYKNGKL